MLPLLLFAIFLGGGNYVSLLPCMLFVVTVTFLLLLQRNKKTYVCGITSAVLLLSFAVSAMAPGNQVRQDGMWKFPRGKPLQSACCRVSAIPSPGPDCGGCLPPCFCCRSSCAFYRRKTGDFSPIPSFYRIFLRIVLLHVLSSVLYHELHRTRPAVAIVYYTFLLISFAVFFYWLGYIVRKLQMRQNTPEKMAVLGKLKIARYVAMTVLLAVILFTGVWQETSAAKAIRMLTNGEAAAYAAEYEERLLLLNDPEITDVVLTPFTHQPAMIYTGDLPGDPEDPTSKKTAQYFGKIPYT